MSNSGTPASADAGNYSIQVTATDSGNLSATEVFGIAVSDVSTGLTLIGTANKDVLAGGAGLLMMAGALLSLFWFRRIP